jgi:dihydroxy-acid dehydratase
MNGARIKDLREPRGTPPPLHARIYRLSRHCPSFNARSYQVPTVLNKFSRHITQPETQGSSQAMLYATGISEADMNKAQVGIASMWFEGNPCNMHLLDLATEVKKGVEAAGLLAWRFNTIGVSDGISMGTNGMSYSLQSRDIIADSIETLASAQWHDACIVIPGCDKNMPGALMALGRLNRPGFMVYGGTIRAGHTSKGEPIDIVSAFTCYGAQLAGNMTDSERREVVRHACPGAGACGGMYTANTMASAIEALGMSLPYSSSIPATDPDKINECHAAGKAILNCLEKDIKPRDVMTREAFENAMVVVMAVGGSTNAVLHLIAMARSVNVPLTIDDFQKVSDRIPYLADLRPSGKYVQEDLHAVGGTPAVMKLLLENGLLNGDCLTITGKTIAENLAALPGLAKGQDVVRPLSDPIKATGHIRIMRGNFCPDGAVAKITGKEGLKFTGTANCFDSEEDMLAAMQHQKIKKGDVVVIRYEGPQGGPGMPEMLQPTGAIMGAGLAKDVALITDGRFSGGSAGFIVGHVTPEAQLGGAIALVKNGDKITIDAEANTITIDLSDDELAKRRKEWKAPPFKNTRGTLYKYIKNVKTASEGCVTDE